MFSYKPKVQPSCRYFRVVVKPSVLYTDDVPSRGHQYQSQEHSLVIPVEFGIQKIKLDVLAIPGKSRLHKSQQNILVIPA